jgi:hypothetical protein
MTKARDTANLTGSGVTLPLLDIDAGTDIGAALVDADLMIVDDGAGGTNRKATMSRLATYMGGKITGGSMVYLASSGAISNAASVAFTQFDASKYDHYEFWFQHLIPVTDGTLLIGYASTDGGSNYDTTNGNYHHDGNVDAPGFYIIDQLVGNGTNEFGVGGKFQLLAPHNASAYTYSISQTSVMTSAGPSLYIASTNGTNGASTVHLVAADVDAIQFKFSSGNIASGEIVMYGIANGT